MEAEAPEDLRIEGRTIEVAGGAHRPLFTGAASDGAPVLRVSIRVGARAVSGLDLISGTGGLGVGGAGPSAPGGDLVRLDEVVLRCKLAAREVDGSGAFGVDVGRVELRRVTVQNSVLTGLQRGAAPRWSAAACSSRTASSPMASPPSTAAGATSTGSGRPCAGWCCAATAPTTARAASRSARARRSTSRQLVRGGRPVGALSAGGARQRRADP